MDESWREMGPICARLTEAFAPLPPFQLSYEPKDLRPLITIGSLMELDPAFMEALDITCVVTCFDASKLEDKLDVPRLVRSRYPEVVMTVSCCPDAARDNHDSFVSVMEQLQHGHQSVLFHCVKGDRLSVIVGVAAAMALNTYELSDRGCSEVNARLRSTGRALRPGDWDKVRKLKSIWEAWLFS